jgi:dimethylhistidine N-methyltransferase
MRSSQQDDGAILVDDNGSAVRDFRDDVIDGLQRSQKTLPSKYFYDAEGSRLFDCICELDAYYPTRTELAIMERHIDDIGRRIGPRAMLIEPGSGSSLKTRILLDHLPEVAAYVPVEICREHLEQAAADLAAIYPDVQILPLCADFTEDFELPASDCQPSRKVVFFPGSTIGNFMPDQARRLLRQMADLAGRGGGLLIGVDLKKDRRILERAYNDQAGVTAAFNRNLLVRINRELDADFDLDTFSHRAFYNAQRGRVEMHLVSDAEQSVMVDGVQIDFDEGESIRTECSHKYSVQEFRDLAASAGYREVDLWIDPDRLFSVQFFEVA